MRVRAPAKLNCNVKRESNLPLGPVPRIENCDRSYNKKNHFATRRKIGLIGPLLWTSSPIREIYINTSNLRRFTFYIRGTIVSKIS